MKCKAYRSRNGSPQFRPTAAHKATATVRAWERQVWQANFIGWHALADSFQRDLDEAQRRLREAKAGRS